MALTLKTKTPPTERLDLGALTPAKLANATDNDIAQINLGKGLNPVHAGDVFTISGSASDGNMTIEGSSSRFDNVAANQNAGQFHVEGDVGHYAGSNMSGGTLVITGNARHHLGSSMVNGKIHVQGDVGDRLGAPRPGVRDGMADGIVIISGKAGDYCGERQRRGLILVKGQVGDNAGGRMLGGTIWSLTGFGTGLGVQMRRGTIITPQLDSPLSTFLDCGPHALGILSIMARHYAPLLGDDAPAFPTGIVRRFAGDMASIGRGEILVTG